MENGTAQPPTTNGAAMVAPATEKAARKRGDGGQIVGDLAIWNHAARIGGGLTPSAISSIVRDADTGDTRRLIDLANECRQRDAHLQAVLSSSEESIAGLAWQIVPATDKPRAKDKRAATWVEGVLRENPGMQRLLADLAGAIYYSFAYSEIIWTKDGGRLVPESFVAIAPRRFRFRRQDGRHVFYDDGATEIDLQAKHPNKFIRSFPRVTGDVPPREGLMRVLVWMSVMRNWSVGDWLKTGELSWKPWRIGTYKKGSGTSPEDREDLEEVMRQLTTDFSVVVPDSCEIEVSWPGGSSSRNSTHAEICTALANEMSKATLGQTETTQSSSSSGYAQAKVHDAVRRDLREARARQVAADITRDLIAPMIRLNFGGTVTVPRFEFITQDPVDLKAFSEAVKTLREAEMRIPEDWAHEEAGIPMPKEGEPCLGNPTGKTPEEQDADGESKPEDEAAAKKPADEEPEAKPSDDAK